MDWRRVEDPGVNTLPILKVPIGITVSDSMWRTFGFIFEFEYLGLSQHCAIENERSAYVRRGYGLWVYGMGVGFTSLEKSFIYIYIYIWT